MADRCVGLAVIVVELIGVWWFITTAIAAAAPALAAVALVPISLAGAVALDLRRGEVR